MSRKLQFLSKLNEKAVVSKMEMTTEYGVVVGKTIHTEVGPQRRKA